MITMYCIVHKDRGETFYLSWQKPEWEETGYFWTRKETFSKTFCNNTKDHPFLFYNREDAIAHLKAINIPQKCSIAKWSVYRKMI